MLLALVTLLAALSQPVIQLERNERGEHYFRVIDGGRGTLAVFVDSQDKTLPALLGSSSTKSGDLIFVPRFSLRPGLTYRAEFRGPAAITKTFPIPAAQGHDATFVQHVYPSTSELPENQLKLYIHFSAPMSRGGVYEAIHLLDEKGAVIEKPFLELEQELWNPELTRFTLLFDPGRVKRDLVPNREAGAPLKPGHRYTLVIDTNLPDAMGRPLRETYRKEFRVVAADRTALDQKNWRIDAPTVSTRDAVAVLFPEPVDHGLAMHAIAVRNAEGRSVPGEVAIDQEERRWRFTPTEIWQPGMHALVIDTALEDLAGNRVGRLFDVDTKTQASAALAATVTRTFVVQDAGIK